MIEYFVHYLGWMFGGILLTAVGICIALYVYDAFRIRR